jgi:hypothetical protein
MRNYTWLAIALGLLGFWFFYVGVWKPDYVIKSESSYGDAILLGITGLYFALWMGMLAKKHSDHAMGYAFYTDLMDIEPLDSVNMIVKGKEENGVKVPSQKFTFDLHASNGCKPLMTRGGGTSGLFIVRRDLKEVMYGDNTNIKIHSAPEIYKMGAMPGDKYRDLNGLPKEILDMVLQSQYFHPKGTVMLFADPISDDPRKNVDKLTGLPYKDLFEQANVEGNQQRKQISQLLNTNTMLTSAHKKAVGAFGGEKPGYEERRRQREEEQDDEER